MANYDRVLLVGDNRPSLNWGGRSAGLSLCELLGRVFQNTETVAGREFHLQTAGYGFVGTRLPARFDHVFLHLHQNRRRHQLFDWYVRLEEFLGAHDFARESAAESAEDLIRYRQHVPELGALYEKTSRADVVVINGEGDFVFTTPPRREVLFMLGMMELSLRLSKKVCFVNAMFSDCPVTGHNETTLREARRLLQRCSAVLLRDHESVAYARRLMPEVDCRLVPDAVFGWYPRAAHLVAALPHDGDLVLPFPEQSEWFGRLDFGRPYICVGGSAAAACDPTRAIESYTALVGRLETLGLPAVLIESDGRDAFLQEVARRTGAGFVPVATPILAAFGILAGARLLVSGRYHPTILASLGGTPSVFLGSTAHKMSSLQLLLEYHTNRCFSAFPDASELDEILGLARSYVDAGSALRDTVSNVAARLSALSLALPELLRDGVGAR